MHPLFHLIDVKEETQRHLAHFLKLWEEEQVICIQTSGSTGAPKEICFTKNQFIVSAKKTIDFFQLTSSSKALLCLSPETIGGKMMLIRALVGGYQLTVTDARMDPLEHIEESIDFIALVPAQLASIVKIPSSLQKLKKIRHVLIGGAAISPELEGFLQKEQIRAFQSYGMTETISHVALREIGKEKSYTALEGIEFSTDNERLIIHYPALQKEAIITNDCVELIDKNSFIWLGRADFVVNSGGKKIHVEALEQRISSFYSESFILSSIPDPTWGEALVMITAHPLTLSKADFQQHLEGFEIPKFWQQSTLIHTKNGKIQRQQTFAQTKAHAWISL
ncbi:MAG: AMP-binding protein [Flavobacteriales bacterium]